MSRVAATVAQTPFWLVWNEAGDMPRFQHQTQESAEAEAGRLARANPGTRFCVLAPVARIMVCDVHIERFLLTDDNVPF